MILSSLATEFRRVRTANTTDLTLPALAHWWNANGLHPGRDAAGNQQPNAGVVQGEGYAVGGYIFPQPGLNGELPNAVMLVPFGTNANNETFTMRVLGYNRYKLLPTDPPHIVAYLQQVLGQFTCTLGNLPEANMTANADGFLADTIEIASDAGNDDIAIDRFSPANDITAHVILDLKSCQTLRVDFAIGTALAANAFYRWLY